MKSYLSVSIRYAGRCLRSTVAVMLGVMLSTAILTCIVTIQETYRLYAIQKNEAEYGSYQAAYPLPDPQTVERVKSHVLVKEAGIVGEIGRTTLENGIDFNRVAVERNNWKLCGLQLISGEMPDKEGECVIEEWAAKELNIHKFPAKLNDWVITGVIKSKLRSLNNYSTLAVSDLANNREKLSKDGKHSLLVRFKDGVDIKYAASALSSIKGLSSSAKENKTLEAGNNDYETLSVQHSLQIIGLIIAAIVLLSVFMSVFSIMNLSVMNRIQHYGLLRAVGMNPLQLMWLVLLETVFICLIALPLGAAAGLGLSRLGAGKLNFLPEGGSGIGINLLNIALCMVFCMFAVVLSSLLPAFRAAKISPLQAISGNPGILGDESSFSPGKRQQRFFKTFGKNGFVFGMAYRNLWRKKGKFIVSVLSLSFAVVVLLTYSFLTKSERETNRERSPGYLSDIEISYNYENIKAVSSIDIGMLKKEIYGIGGVKNVYKTDFIDHWWDGPRYGLLIRKKDFTDEYGNFQHNNYLNESYAFPGYVEYDGFSIFSYGEEELETAGKYVLEGRIDKKKMLSDNEVLIPKYVTTLAAHNIPYTSLKPGDRIQLLVYDEPRSQSSRSIELKIGGILDCAPFVPTVCNDGFFIIVRPELFEELLGGQPKNIVLHKVYIDKEEKTNLNYLHNQLIQLVKNFPGYSADLGQKHGKLREALAKSYHEADNIAFGILGCIALIALLNIMNTISIRFITRTREFGMLKSIGMSPAQLNGMVLAECFLYGAFSWMIGTGIGFLLNFAFYRMLSKDRYILWITPWREMGVAFAVCMIGCLLASVFPIRRMARFGAVEAIRAID